MLSLQLFLVLYCGCYFVMLNAGNAIENYENYYNEIHTEDEDAELKTRNALQSPLQRWPDNRLYYRIAADYTAAEAQNVREALELFNEQTCLTFEELPKGSTDIKRYIYYKKSLNVCGTVVGFNPVIRFGAHDVQLNANCLTQKGVIQHETLHVLGLYHEHSRPDRDDYVQIDYDNIERKYWPQFMAQSNAYTTTYNVPYDYESLMHYSQYAFAKDSTKPTIRALINGELVERDMGQVSGPSVGDLTKVRIMYKCVV